MLLGRERRGVYPGGKARHAERSILLARMLTYSVERCIEQGGFRRGCDLYLRGLAYYRRTGSWPYNARPLGIIKQLGKQLHRSWRGPASHRGTRDCVCLNCNGALI